LDGQWAPLIFITGDEQLYKQRYGEMFTLDKVVEFLTSDQKNPNSILSCLRQARENARAVRDMISSAMWEEINKFFLFVRQAADDKSFLRASFDFFHKVKLSSHLVQGITDATMSHNEAWHFVRMARLLERADKTSRILDVKYFVLLPTLADVGTPFDTIQWAALLKSASALEMYRKIHGRITPRQVADFLMLDREFSRAMHFCLIKAEDSLLAITGSPAGTFRNVAEQRLGRLRSELDYAQINELIEGGLHEFIDRFQIKMIEVGDAISETFFGVESTPHPLRQSDAANGQAQSLWQKSTPSEPAPALGGKA
jgi:uncharacterized alpha-E superfamily protein